MRRRRAGPGNGRPLLPREAGATPRRPPLPGSRSGPARLAPGSTRRTGSPPHPRAAGEWPRARPHETARGPCPAPLSIPSFARPRPRPPQCPASYGGAAPLGLRRVAASLPDSSGRRVGASGNPGRLPIPRALPDECGVSPGRAETAGEPRDGPPLPPDRTPAHARPTIPGPGKRILHPKSCGSRWSRECLEGHAQGGKQCNARRLAEKLRAKPHRC